MNDTTSPTSISQLPANILEAFIPGYSVVSKFILDALGIDISLLVTACFLIFAVFTSVNYAWDHAYSFFRSYFMSFISVDSDDDIYDYIMAWLVDHQVSRTSRRLTAKTGRGNAWDQDGDFEESNDDDTSGTLLNFSNWDAKIPPKFQPYFGNHWFFHHGRLFQLMRDTKQMMYQQGWGGSTFTTEEVVRIACVGRSTGPIKDLIKECRDHYIDKEKSCTVVRRPAPKEIRSRGRTPWTKVATRPSRPMDTVILDHERKARLLADINEYLHPATPRWYANRGIPYRRGYLFSGPPGTGKSSLAWAIAGVFGLDIYCISLVEPSLTEEDLGVLFSNLPRRCVVLLEDIDSAGLVKRQEPEEAEKPKSPDSNAQIGAEIAKALKSVQDTNKKGKDNNPGISLSGLLNAIDGVASHEGRVLVMTTNFPEKLDDALIRPGRVDMQISFTMATRTQMRELFIRMYSSDVPNLRPKSEVPASSAKTMRSRRSSKPNKIATILAENVLTPPASPRYSDTPLPETSEKVEKLEDIAERFAERMPEGKFTPAEIQGFFLTRKKEPLRALEEVVAWRDKLLEAKAAKNKVLNTS